MNMTRVLIPDVPWFSVSMDFIMSAKRSVYFHEINFGFFPLL